MTVLNVQSDALHFLTLSVAQLDFLCQEKPITMSTPDRDYTL
jgi:hypothetical protein